MLGITTTNARVGGFRGLGKIAKLILAYFARVIAAGGVTEGRICLSNSLSSLDSKQLLDNASLVLIPSGYKAGVIYSQVPTSGLGDLDVVRATTATRVNSSALIETSAVATPRLDYTNSSCPSLLVEPQRTNLVPNPFAYTGSQVAFNTAVVNSPISGGLSTRITKNEPAGTLRYASQVCSGTALSSLTAYTLSAFFKYDGYNVLTTMEYNNSSQWGGTTWQQLINISSTGITLGSSSACTSTIENYGNGWYRVNVRITTGAVILGSPPVAYLLQVASSLSTGQGFLHTAAQLELGSSPTSYIPTVAAAVTRNADVISKTGISSLIGQTEGTIFFDINLTKTPSDANGRFLQLWATNDTTNAIIPILNQSNQFQISMFKDSIGNPVIPASSSTFLDFGRNKIAIAYTSTTLSVYKNGALLATGNPTTVFPSSLNSLDLGCSSFANRSLENTINSAILYKTRLSNAELASLTTI
jgi:hypothetical protein